MTRDDSLSTMRAVFYAGHNAFRQKVAKGEKVADIEYNNSPSSDVRNAQLIKAANWMYELAEVVDEWTKEYDSRTRLMHPYAPYMGCAYRHPAGPDGKSLWFKLACVYTK
ncbi:hypothetical protein COOONC_05115 [Cooperia oncophora]